MLQMAEFHGVKIPNFDFVFNSVIISIYFQLLSPYTLVVNIKITELLNSMQNIMLIRKFTVHVLLKPGLENFEHYFTSV